MSQHSRELAAKAYRSASTFVTALIVLEVIVSIGAVITVASGFVIGADGRVDVGLTVIGSAVVGWFAASVPLVGGLAIARYLQMGAAAHADDLGDIDVDVEPEAGHDETPPLSPDRRARGRGRIAGSSTLR